MKSLKADKKYSFLVKNRNGKRGPKRRLMLEKVIARNLLQFFLHVKDLKAFHRIIQATDVIRELSNYEHFLKAANKAFPIITVFMLVLFVRRG